MYVISEEDQKNQGQEKKQGGVVNQGINLLNNFIGPRFPIGKQAAAQGGKQVAAQAGKMAAQGAAKAATSNPWIVAIVIGVVILLFVVVLLVVLFSGKDKYSSIAPLVGPLLA